jgi:hypothetical protein
MPQFRLFFTVIFLLVSIAIFSLVLIFEQNLIYKVAEIVKNHLWITGILVIIFLVLFSSGVVSNLDSIKPSLIRNGYFQLAILELFLFSSALGYFWYFNQQPGQIVIKLQTETNVNYINLAVTYKSNGTIVKDTVRAPGKLYKKPPGKYHIEILDENIIPFKTDVMLEPAVSETLTIPVTQNSKTLAIKSEPDGADIWINGVQATKTPDTFEIRYGDTITLDLKMPGYQVYTDTLFIDRDQDLGIINLKKLYTVWISSRYADTMFNIYDKDNKIIYSSRGSRKLQLAQGRYRLIWEIGEGQYDKKSFSVNYNSTVLIP